MDLKNKLKVLLIGPYKGLDSTGDSFLAPPFGLNRMKFYIEKKIEDVSIEILDPNLDDYTKADEHFAVIGFSPLHLTFQNDLALFNHFKQKNPEALFIAGGIEVSFIAKDVFKFAPFDVIVIGEGEKALLEILKAILAGKTQFDGIKSIYWRFENDIHFNGYGQQLDIVEYREIYEAIDYSRIPYDRYWGSNARLYKSPNWREIRAIRSIFSNFCPYRCKFCASTNYISYSYSGKLTGGRFHFLPIEDVAQTILKITRAWESVETIIFDDDNLSINHQYLQNLCIEIVRLKKIGMLKKDLSFICQGRADSFIKQNAKTLDLMKAAGFRMVMFGIESFSNNALAFLGKKITREQAIEAIQATRSAGIVPLIYLILFPPHISKKDLIETIDAAVEQLSNNLEVSTTLLVMNIPGSAFYYDSSLRRIYDKHSVSKEISIEKSDYIWPADEEMFKLSIDIYKNYDIYEERFKKEYGMTHAPSRIYSLIVFDVVYRKLGLEKRVKAFRKKIRKAIKNYL